MKKIYKLGNEISYSKSGMYLCLFFFLRDIALEIDKFKHSKLISLNLSN